MRLTFDVEYTDGRKFQAHAGPKDFVSFERQFDQPIGAFSEQKRYEWVCYLAWAPLHREGTEPGDFDTFLGLIEDVDMAADQEPVDPTPAAPSDVPSPS